MPRLLRDQSQENGRLGRDTGDQQKDTSEDMLHTQRWWWRLRAAGRAPQRRAAEPTTVKSQESRGSTDGKILDYCNKSGSDTGRKEML